MALKLYAAFVAGGLCVALAAFVVFLLCKATLRKMLGIR